MIQLRTNGLVYQGWKDVSVRLGIRQLCGQYSLGIAETFDESKIVPGNACTVEIEDAPVITGYVDTVSGSFDAGSVSISVTGRDRGGDLVDCSAPVKQYIGLTVSQLARVLCEPFGIKVIDQVGGGVKTTHQANAGESVFSIIEKAARAQAMLVYSDGLGNVVLSRAGLAGKYQTPLKHGVDFEQASFEHSFAEVYSSITVLAQGQASNAPTLEGHNNKATVKANSVGGAIGRYRPLIVQAEKNGTLEHCQKRAAWEASTRLAKSRKFSVQLAGWLASDRKPWRVNTLVRLVSERMRVDADMLIEQVEFAINESGSVTKLDLVDPQAYTELPEIPNTARAKGIKDSARVVSQQKYVDALTASKK